MSERHPNGYWPSLDSARVTQPLLVPRVLDGPGEVPMTGPAPLPDEVAQMSVGPARPAWVLSPANVALVDVVREAARSGRRLNSLGAALDLSAAQIREAGGELWRKLREANAAVKGSGHPGGRDGHAGCGWCDLVSDLDKLVGGGSG